MNKKENEQLKKIEKLDKELDNTINKIGAPKAKPVKLSKKKLALYILIPFSIACVISAVASFFLIDPFHWYTNSRLSLEQQEAKEIERLTKEFEDLNLASGLDNTSTIEYLIWEVKHHPTINDILKNPNDIPSNTNELKTVTSKKSNDFNLSDQGENITIKILVKTGSLTKEIDINLNVIIDNKKVKLIKSFLEHKAFLDEIKKAIEADGEKRVSDLNTAIKNIIAKNDIYKDVFKDIEYDITNDKDDNEIIASGPKILSVNFNFTENNKLISSSLKLNIDLQGKSRKGINQLLADLLPKDMLSFGERLPLEEGDPFFAQTVFANKATYQDLIDELISFAPKYEFYLRTDVFEKLDNTDSKVSIDFTIEGKTTKKNHEIISGTDKEFVVVELQLQFFVGNEINKGKSNKVIPFVVNVLNKDHVNKDFFLNINKLRNVSIQGLSKYKAKTSMGKTYDELNKELNNKLEQILKLENKVNLRIVASNYYITQKKGEIISKENLINKWYYIFRIEFINDNKTVVGTLWYESILYLSIRVGE